MVKGKGEAVRQGIFNAQGHILLFMDADGATQLEDIGLIFNKMLKLIKKEFNGNEDIPIAKLIKEKKIISGGTRHGAVIVGSRAHLQKEAIAKRSFYRYFFCI